MKLHVLLALASMPAAPLMAQEPSPPSVPSAPSTTGNQTSEELKKQLIEAVQAELAQSKGEQQTLAYDAAGFLQMLEAMSPEAVLQGSAEPIALANLLPNDMSYSKSKALARSYQRQLQSEVLVLQVESDKRATEKIMGMLKEAMASEDATRIAEIGQEFEAFRRDLNREDNPRSGRFRRSDLLNDSSGINNFIRTLARFRSFNNKENLSNAVSTLRQLREALPQLARYVPQTEAAAFLAAAERKLGLLPNEQAQKLIETLVAELFDDANQDRLDSLIERIQSQQVLANSTESALSSKWQTLSSMAERFRREVGRVKDGQPSQFRADQWNRSNSGMADILPQQALEKHLVRYQVEVKGADGTVSKIPMSYDIREITARIKGPADLQRELPVLSRALTQRSASGDSGSWQWVISQMIRMGDLHTKLESGNSFPLTASSQSEYGGDERLNLLGGDEAASQMLKMLRNQINTMILQRFYPDLKIEENATPEQTVDRLFRAAVKSRDYDAVLTLNPLAAYITPGKALLSPQDGLAVQLYLNGVKQQEQLLQPRLAAMYFQRAAAIDSSILPTQVLRDRLLKLKSDSREDYEKGTDDAIKPFSDGSSYGFQRVLVVPEKAGANGD